MCSKIDWKHICMPLLDFLKQFQIFFKLLQRKYVLNMSVPFLTRAGWQGLLSMPCCCCRQNGDGGHAWCPESASAHAHHQQCAWPASCVPPSAHALPAHKLLSSSGARRLGLGSGSSHCNVFQLDQFFMSLWSVSPLSKHWNIEHVNCKCCHVHC